MVTFALSKKENCISATAERISAETAHKHLESDPDAMLVCAYDDNEKFEQNHLQGAFSLDKFESQTDSLRKDREIIFYCA
jgi:3-mercaptopyruvate sulfurtransferase SseA